MGEPFSYSLPGGYRGWRAGEPASSKQEDDDQPEDDEAEDLAEAVGPTAEAYPGHESDYSDTAFSIVTGVTHARAPSLIIDVIADDVDLSPGRRVVYHAGTVGWVKTARPLLGKATIGNAALRKPDGGGLNPGRRP
eukprot:9409292-Pyramimonas_sp.AAC.1